MLEPPRDDDGQRDEPREQQQPSPARAPATGRCPPRWRGLARVGPRRRLGRGVRVGRRARGHAKSHQGTHRGGTGGSGAPNVRPAARALKAPEGRGAALQRTSPRGEGGARAKGASNLERQWARRVTRRRPGRCFRPGLEEVAWLDAVESSQGGAVPGAGNAHALNGPGQSTAMRGLDGDADARGAFVRKSRPPRRCGSRAVTVRIRSTQRLPTGPQCTHLPLLHIPLSPNLLCSKHRHSDWFAMFSKEMFPFVSTHLAALSRCSRDPAGPTRVDGPMGGVPSRGQGCPPSRPHGSNRDANSIPGRALEGRSPVAGGAVWGATLLDASRRQVDTLSARLCHWSLFRRGRRQPGCCVPPVSGASRDTSLGTASPRKVDVTKPRGQDRTAEHRRCLSEVVTRAGDPLRSPRERRPRTCRGWRRMRGCSG